MTGRLRQSEARRADVVKGTTPTHSPRTPVGGFQGQAYITTGMQALGAAASVAGPGAGAAILGGKFVEGAKAMPRTIETHGTVTVPNINVNPVGGSFSLVPVGQ